MMPTDREAAIDAAIRQLVGLLVAAGETVPPKDVPDRLLGVGEAAALLGLGRSSTYAEIQGGRLRSLKVGRRRLVPSSAIRDFCEAARSTSPGGLAAIARPRLRDRETRRQGGGGSRR